MLVIGSDHAGYPLKKDIIKFLENRQIDFFDVGTYDGEKGDYPKYALLVAQSIISGKAEKGLLFCGSGVGMSISANKINGIRCVVCSEPYSAIMSRQHNDCNVLALGSRVVGPELAILIVESWLQSNYEKGRHKKRLEQIALIEKQKENAVL